MAGADTLAMIAAFLAVTIFYALPSNVLAAREGEPARRVAVELAPQGWAFFTKDPDDDEYVPYRWTGDRFESLLATPQSRAENGFGLSRRQRAQGVEMGLIGSQVEEWVTCTAGVSDACRREALEAPANVAENASPVATLCGEILLVSNAPVPWAYRDFYEEARMDNLAARVDVECTAT